MSSKLTNCLLTLSTLNVLRIRYLLLFWTYSVLILIQTYCMPNDITYYCYYIVYCMFHIRKSIKMERNVSHWWNFISIYVYMCVCFKCVHICVLQSKIKRRRKKLICILYCFNTKSIKNLTQIAWLYFYCFKRTINIYEKSFL